MSTYDDAVKALRAALPPEPGLRDLVRFATLAPNSHNTQPWQFRLGDDTVDVLPDFSRRTPVVDPDDHHLYVTLRSSAGLAVFAAHEDGPAGWIEAGRSFERFALQSTALGIRHAHVNMPVEVPSLRPAFADWLGMPGRRPDLVVRFGRAEPMPMSVRRPLDDVIIADN